VAVVLDTLVDVTELRELPGCTKEIRRARESGLLALTAGGAGTPCRWCWHLLLVVLVLAAGGLADGFLVSEGSLSLKRVSVLVRCEIQNTVLAIFLSHKEQRPKF